MLSFFRRLIESRVGKFIFLVILAVIALAFLLSDVSGGLGGVGGGGGNNQTIATVGGNKIGAAEVSRAVEREMSNARQQSPGLDAATFVVAGGADRTLEALIAARALEFFARGQGMAASKRMVDGEIASIPAFNGPAGTFDQNTFRAVLAQQRLNEADVRRDIEGDVLRRMLLAPVAGAAQAPAGVTTPYATLLLEDRRGTIGFVPTAALPAAKAPTDAEVQAYYNRNIGRYTLGERRVIRYALFGPETLQIPAPEDAEIQAYYNANSATYGGKTTRTLSQIVFPDEAAANTFAQKVKGGTAFAAAAQTAGYAPADTLLGPQTQAQFAEIATPAAATAVFALPEGGVSAPLKSELGWHVVRVDAITASAARPLASVRAEIAKKLGDERRATAIADEVAAIEDAVAGGASFDDVAKQRKLTVVTTPPVLANGTAPGVADYRPPAELAGLLKEAFQAATDEDPTVQKIGETGTHALFGVTRIDPPKPIPLAELRSQVVAAMQAESGFKAAKAIADAIAAKAGKGTPLTAAFSQAGVRLPAPAPAGGRRLEISRGGSQVPPPLAAMFAMAPGRARVIPAPDNQGWFVVKLETITKGDLAKAPGLLQTTQRQFSPVFAREYAEQFVRAVQGSIGVKQDSAAFATLKARIAGNAPAQ